MKYRNVVAESEFKIKQTQDNTQKLAGINSSIELYKGLISDLDVTLATIKPWIADIQEFNAAKKHESLLAINSALSVASCVVPSSMKGIVFKIEGKEAWLENEDGMDVDRLEGSGYKGVVSIYLRNIILKANTDLLQFMILDEPLSKLSVESSAILSSYIPLMAKDMQIIWIEHKKEVFQNVEDKVVYNFFKDDNNHTIATRERS